MRKLISFSLLTLILAAIVSVFWHNDAIYNLPTPVPVNYHDIKPGTLIQISSVENMEKGKPVFLHFFNPDCPCSKFNMPHFKSLVKKYQNKVSFIIVVQTKNKSYTTQIIKSKYDLTIPVIFDNSLALSCGVYSTPQAVLLNEEHKLVYKGNYNKSRYCISSKSNYAQMAIDSFLNNHYQPNFDQLALTAYGCQIPGCFNTIQGK